MKTTITQTLLRKGALMRLLTLLCLLPALLFAANYYEAKGQTAAFLLKAGSKAAWNPSAAIEKSVVKATPDVFSIRPSVNGLFVQTGKPGNLHLFDISGRLATTLSVARDGFVPLSRGLANGIYVARFDAAGVSMRATKLAIVR